MENYEVRIILFVLSIVCYINFKTLCKLERKIENQQNALNKQDKINKEIIELLTRNMEQLGIFLSGKI